MRGVVKGKVYHYKAAHLFDVYLRACHDDTSGRARFILVHNVNKDRPVGVDAVWYWDSVHFVEVEEGIEEDGATVIYVDSQEEGL